MFYAVLLLTTTLNGAIIIRQSKEFRNSQALLDIFFPIREAGQVVIALIAAAFTTNVITIIQAVLTVMTGFHWISQYSKALKDVENLYFKSHVAAFPL